MSVVCNIWHEKYHGNTPILDLLCSLFLPFHHSSPAWLHAKVSWDVGAIKSSGFEDSHDKHCLDERDEQIADSLPLAH